MYINSVNPIKAIPNHAFLHSKINAVHNVTNPNIAFARGGAHLPIAHALRLPETEIIFWGGDFFYLHPMYGGGVTGQLGQCPNFYSLFVF